MSIIDDARALARRDLSGASLASIAAWTTELRNAVKALCEAVELREAAAAHWFHCRQCAEGVLCEDGQRHAAALGYGELDREQ
mgnify:CR=1 FL=1